MFFCIPLLFGCSTSIKPSGAGKEQTAHFCPRCNNASVYSAKSRTWLEFFFIPLVPVKTKHIWMCGICQWAAPLAPGNWEPPIAYQNPQGSFGHQLEDYSPPSGGFQAGYQPSYDQPPGFSPNRK
ncbi:hypothetical protein BDP27DRAFT_1319630 [Rhodocollybia butyracea]|uniref:Zinc-ribbon 15 domain-containing protein n=1 Tax=Rhodocollybia butyracea TaxID=206335 RepID=A0A9P5PUZ4_9AGAR|nr:hypothetical protein BDP27DRAFT_1319630 [Rhodocollybia butyracea]